MNLNLARKWRSRNFDEVIGQDLSVRMLKNSLYLNHYFPVYLFSGQRGCGKTTTARIFARAVNCQQLSLFQQNPRNYSVPCLQCDSCSAMISGNHPDFIEIDAASHTGVDNVRTIIEAASFLPLLGKKKIYLIDEAHMLSKAAFNAFLKILEEPPCSVLFMLATTDIQKVIDTVRSRSFQLFFKAVSHDQLSAHLEFICKQENILYEQAGLSSIIMHAQGSVRDALNILEQIRFSSGSVTKKAVSSVIGECDEEIIIMLVEYIFKGDERNILLFSHEQKLEHYHCLSIWQRLIDNIRTIMLLQYRVTTTVSASPIERLKRIATSFSVQTTTTLLQILYDYELLLIKTTMPYQSFEMMLIALTQQCKKVVGGTTQIAPLEQSSLQQPALIVSEKKSDSAVVPESEKTIWQTFLSEIETLKDPLLSSIFTHARFISQEQSTGVVMVAFAQEFIFFNDWLENARTWWMPLLQKIFGKDAQLKPSFTDPKNESLLKNFSTPKVNSSSSSTLPVVEKKTINIEPFRHKKFSKNFEPRTKTHTIIQETMVDVSDAQLWKKSHLLLQFFPGIIVEYKESNS